MKKIQKRPSDLDRSAMHWLLQELDEDDMDTFLSGIPGYLHSPLTDKKVVGEGLIEDGVPGRIREHIATCLRPVELSQEDSMSRASTCINSLRLISEAASETATLASSSESGDIQEIMGYLEPLCYISSTALRASCIRGLVIREFLIPLVDLDARNSLTRFPNYAIPLHRAIGTWKTTEIAQWSHMTGILTLTDYPLPNDLAQVQQDLYDGPLINLAVLAYAVLSRADEGDINFDMAWKTLETLLKSLGLAQVRASSLARARFDEVLRKARDGVSGYDGGVTLISPLLKTLDIAIRGLRLAEAFAYTPKLMLSRRQIEAIFGPEQLRNTELVEAFAAHLPKYVIASTPEVSRKFMERLILEDKLWEQLHVSLLKLFDPEVPFPDKSRIIMAFFDIFDVAFNVLKESTIIDWRSEVLDLLFEHFQRFSVEVAPSEPIDWVINFRSTLFCAQFCHALLSQFAIRHSSGESLILRFSNSLSRLIRLLGVGTQEDLDILTTGTLTGFDMMIKASPIVDLTLRDGPLSNFCLLGKAFFDIMVSDMSDQTSDNIKKLRKTLERTVNDPVSFADSSGVAWTRFDQLCTLVRDPAHLEGNSETVEILRPLLDMIEEVERIRPPADAWGEGTENVDNQTLPGGSADSETMQLSGRLIPGSSRQVEASHGERREPVATFSSPFHGTIPLAEMPRYPSRGRTSYSSSGLEWVTIDDPTRSVEPRTPQLGMAPIPGSSRQVDALRSGVGAFVDPRLAPSIQASIHTAGMDPFAPGRWTRRSPSDLYPVAPDAPPTSSIPITQAGPHVPQIHPLALTHTYIPSLSGPRRTFSLDPANLPVQDTSPPPGHMLAHPSSSLGPPDVPQLSRASQGGGPVVWTGGLETQEPDSKAGMFLFLILQYLVAD